VVVDIPDCVFSNLAKPRTVFRHGSAVPVFGGHTAEIENVREGANRVCAATESEQAYVIAWFIVRYNSAVAGDDVLVDAGTDG